MELLVPEEALQQGAEIMDLVATVRISGNDTEAKLEVKDDGRGMSEKRQMEIYSGESSGVGLQGMRERVRQISGTLGIQSSAIGTSITVVLPLVAKTRTAK
jgi:two-component system, NarL family, sensor kinase